MEHIESIILEEYVMGELDFHDTEKVRQHLDKCSSCEKLYQTEKAFQLELSGLGYDEPTVDFGKSVIAALEVEGKSITADSFSFRLMKGLLILSLLIAILFPLIIIATQEFTFEMSDVFVNNIIIPIASMSGVLWILYALDRILRRSRVKIS